jgi:hypothetical protein
MSRRLSHDFYIIGCADALSIPHQIATQIGVGIPRYLLNSAGKSEDGQSIHTGYVLY